MARKAAIIQSLTPEQTAQFPAYVDRWTRIGLSTEPANRPAAEAGIAAAYAIAKLPAPRIVWCISPLAMALTRAMVVQAADTTAVWASVRASVGASVRASVRASVGDSVGDSVGASVGDSVGASVGDSVWASVGDSVWASVGDSVWASVGGAIYGQHDAPWIALYAYFREVCGLTVQTEALSGLRAVCENAGWWMPREHICWVSERTSVLHRDAQQRLHCEDGPALSYPDGWSLYRWHGVTIPAWVVEQPQDITPAKIQAESNAEVRRVMLTKYGLARYLDDTGAAEIHRDRDAHGQRVLYELRDPLGVIKLVRLENSTLGPDGQRSQYTFRVDPRVTTCAAAVAYLYSLPEHAYAPVAES